MAFFDHLDVLIAVALVSTPVYISLARMFWGDDFESLGETIKYLITPDLWSLVIGRFRNDWYATLKFNVFLFLCLAWAAAITELLARHLLSREQFWRRPMSCGRRICFVLPTEWNSQMSVKEIENLGAVES